MLKTVLDHQKATVISEELPISFSGVSLLRRSGVCLCGISNLCTDNLLVKCLYRWICNISCIVHTNIVFYLWMGSI